MKLTNFDNPVMSSWFSIKGARLDSKPYLSGALEARVLLEKLQAKKDSLMSFTKGYSDGIYNGPQFVRNYVDSEEHGVPFLTSGSMLLADLSRVDLLRKKDALSSKLSYLKLEEGMTLISCSGTVGRMVYAGPYMNDVWSSQDVLKVVPDPNKILPGYLYAYLSSKFGVPQVTEGTYGAIIQHLEPSHIADLPVPWLESNLETAVHRNITEAAHLRSGYQTQVKMATERLFSSVGLQDITAEEWHSMGPDLGFSHAITSSETLRAVNFNPRLQKLVNELSKTNHMLLGDICKNGMLRNGLRFKRIDCEPEFGVRLVGQRELFWLEPEGRWISAHRAPRDIFVEDETILVTSQGSLGKVELVTGPWTQYAYSQHFLRVRSGEPSLSNPFLFAFLRSEMAYRCFNSFSVGTIQQDLHRSLLFRLPVPIPPQIVREEIDRLVKDAYKKRHEASKLEKAAVEMVEKAIEEGAKWRSLSR